ncbi:MarR family transcriptional regulator, partial [Trinickia terrae]
REKSATDGRSIRVVLTEKGEELTLSIMPLAKRHEAVVLRDFAAGDVQVLRAMLIKLYENAEALDDLP